MTATVDRLKRYVNGHPRRGLVGLVALGFLLLPVGVEDFFVGVVTQAVILGLFAVSVDIALGYTGLITLAPAAFFGMGAYTVAKLVVDFDGPFLLGLPLSVLVAAVVALPIGYIPIKRRIGTVYFVLFTMAFGVIVYDFTFVATEITGGSNGLGYIALPTVLGINLAETLSYYYFALAVVGLTVGTLYLLVASDYGDVLHAIRQNEQRMRYLGYDTDREKILAWLLSASVSSLAGALYVGTIGLASPALMSFALTGEALIWVVVGGAGTFAGPFVAAFVLTLLENSLGSLWAEGYLIVLGLLFVAFIFLLPEGVMGLLDRE